MHADLLEVGGCDPCCSYMDVEAVASNGISLLAYVIDALFSALRCCHTLLRVPGVSRLSNPT